MTATLMLIAATAALLQIVHSQQGFVHIGSFKSGGGLQGRTNGNFNANDYYVTMETHKASWTTAQQDCKNIFGSDANSVSIETEKEWNFLKEMLESYGFASTYWTGGIYDSGSNTWRWAANGIAFAQWAPWDIGQPPSSPTAIQRVIINQSNRYSASWSAISNSQSHRYICEVPTMTTTLPTTTAATTKTLPPITTTIPVPTTTIPVPTTTVPSCDADLIILLDSSDSIGSLNYINARQFAANLSAQFKQRSLGRVGFSIFFKVGLTTVSIVNKLTPAEITTTILSVPYLRGYSDIYMGIDTALAQFTSFPRSVPLNIMVLTDGKFNNSISTADAVSRANKMGVRILSVAISPSANLNELNILANGNSRNLFTSSGSHYLILTLDRLIDELCFSSN